MDSREITALLAHVDNFLGVYPSDCLPSKEKERRRDDFGLIVNTDPANEEGTHWLAIVVRQGICHYFDSFGGTPHVETIRAYCEQFQTCFYNRAKHQQMHEITCGAYCIFVINEMLFKKKSFRSVVSTFHRVKRDDLYVRKYLKERFSFHLPPLQ